MKLENDKGMTPGRHGSEHSKKNQEETPVGKVREDKPQGANIQGQTEPKGMGGTGGQAIDKERPRDSLDTDKQSYIKKGGASPDIQSTDTSSKAGFRRNDDKDADERGASTSGIPGQGL